MLIYHELEITKIYLRKTYIKYFTNWKESVFSYFRYKCRMKVFYSTRCEIADTSRRRNEKNEKKRF